MQSLKLTALIGLVAASACLGKRSTDAGDANDKPRDSPGVVATEPAVVQPVAVQPAARVASALAAADQLRTGDLVFIESKAKYAAASSVVMPGELNHVGLVFVSGDGPQVVAAEGRLDQVPFGQWIAQANGRVVAKRLVDAETMLTDDAMLPIKQFSLAMRGKSYDFAFEWNEDAMYSAEYVHKAFARGPKVELGRKTTIEALGVDATAAQQLGDAHGTTIGLQTEVVTPMSIFEDAQLVTVFDAAAP